MVTLKFDEITNVPIGGSVVHKVYDGANCRSYHGGAKDITGNSNYVIAGLISTQEETKNENKAPPLGFFLQWPSGAVKESPLYKLWDSPATKSGDDQTEYGTIDLCVGVYVNDAAGKETSYSETYVMTTWDRGVPLSVRAVPLSQPAR